MRPTSLSPYTRSGVHSPSIFRDLGGRRRHRAESRVTPVNIVRAFVNGAASEPAAPLERQLLRALVLGAERVGDLAEPGQESCPPKGCAGIPARCHRTNRRAA